MLKFFHVVRACALFSVSLAISACAPEAYVVQPSHEAAARPSPVTLYMYPAKHQTPAQQDRDRYECYLWARKQSGYDPGAAQLAPDQRIEVRSATPPGSDTAAGAVGGAVLGTMLSPNDNGMGTVFGAITGAMIGASSDQAKQQQAENIQQQYNERERRRYAAQERQARNYRRAMTACAEGRGYTVR